MIGRIIVRTLAPQRNARVAGVLVHLASRRPACDEQVRRESGASEAVETEHDRFEVVDEATGEYRVVAQRVEERGQCVRRGGVLEAATMVEALAEEVRQSQ